MPLQIAAGESPPSKLIRYQEPQPRDKGNEIFCYNEARLEI